MTPDYAELVTLLGQIRNDLLRAGRMYRALPKRDQKRWPVLDRLDEIQMTLNFEADIVERGMGIR